jgi:hypothetical protein
MLTTEHFTRGASRAFVRYDDLLSSWENQIMRVAEPLHATWMAEAVPDRRAQIGAFVDPSLRRSQVGWDDVPVPDPLREMIDTVWEQLSGLTRPGGENDGAYDRLDASRDLYRRRYAEAEATAHSSIHAARHRKSTPPAKADPSVRGRLALARRLPTPLRRLLPVELRRRMLGSR